MFTWRMVTGVAQDVCAASAWVVAPEVTPCTTACRISYRPYRDMSERFFKLLFQLEDAAVVERASIDEAFILCRLGAASMVSGAAS